MRLRFYPDPVLRQPTHPVTVFDGALADLAREMAETMRAHGGLGLAAPQVGREERLFLVSPDGEPGREVVMVNPEIVHAEGAQVGEEGCLSFPGIFVKLRRFQRVRVRYQDLEGRQREMETEGLLARAVQHEYDHLEGRLLVDRMSQIQRMAHRRQLRELRERFAQAAEAAPSAD